MSTSVPLTISAKSLSAPDIDPTHPSMKPRGGKLYGCLYCPVLPLVSGVRVGADYKGGGRRREEKCVKTLRMKGKGPTNAAVLAVMDRPCGASDKMGEFRIDPYVKDFFDAGDIDIGQIRFTHAVRCGLPPKKNVTDAALRACNGYLANEIAKADPDIIVVFGAIALRAIAGPDYSITACFRNPFRIKVCGRERIIFPMLSPAFLKYDDSQMPEWFEASRNLADIIHGDAAVVSGHGAYRRITDAREAARMLDQIDSGRVAVDFETNCLEPVDSHVPVFRLHREDGSYISVPQDKKDKAKISIVSWTTKPNQGYYVVLSHVDGGWDKHDRAVFNRALRDLFVRNSVLKLFWNAVFECSWIMKHLDCTPVNFIDVMLMHYQYNENEKHGLKLVAQQLTSIGNWSNQVERLATLVGHNYSCIPLDVLGPYAAADVDATIRIYLKIRKKLDPARDRLVRIFYPRLITTIARMQVHGAKGDVSAAKLFRDYTRRQADTRHRSILELPTVRRYIRRKRRRDPNLGKSGEWSFNLNSVHQLRDLFYGMYKYLPQVKDENDTESFSGDLSSAFQKSGKTDKEALNYFHTEYKCPLAPLLLEWKKYDKQNGTYAKPLLQQMRRFDGFIHGHFIPHGTRTGRLSSSGPNLQNQPVDARRLYVSRFGDEGCLVSADYSQIEVRVAACVSNDPLLLAVYNAGEDVHTATMCRIFNISKEEAAALECDDPKKFKRLRTIAKRIVFGVIYGIGPDGVQRVLRAEGVVISAAEAQSYISKFFKVYRGLRKWIDRTNNRLFRDLYTTSPFGRRRHLPTVKSAIPTLASRARRQGPNAIVQGTASDFTLTAMILIDAALRKRKMRSRIVINVHDSIILDCPRKEAPVVAKIVKRIMENIPTLSSSIWGDDLDWSWIRCPLVSEVEIGLNWRDSVKYDPSKDDFEKVLRAAESMQDAEDAKIRDKLRELTACPA